jgi:hypothetical protein
MTTLSSFLLAYPTFNNSTFQTFRAFSVRSLTRIPTTATFSQAPEAEYEHSMAQYRAMQNAM